MLAGDALLWFDDSETRSDVDKIGRAVARYQKKYGHKPTVCYVSHMTDIDDRIAVQGVKVLPSKSVLQYHFWLGVESDDDKKRKSSKGR